MIERISKTESIAVGIATALIGGPIIAFIGFLLSLTLIGGIVGVPLMILGGLMFFPGIILAPASFAITGKRLKCPYCSKKKDFYIYEPKAFTCSECKKRVLIKDNKVALVTA